jgi:hypothetical protein
MNETQNNFGYLDTVPMREIGAKPVVGPRLQKPTVGSSQEGLRKNAPRKERPITGDTTSVPTPGALAQQRLRNTKIASGKRLVEAWLPKEIAERLGAEADALGMSRQDLIAKILARHRGKT